MQQKQDCFTHCLPHKDADDDFNVWMLGAVLLCYCVVINSFCLPCVSFYPGCLESNVWPSIMANTESHDRAPCTLWHTGLCSTAPICSPRPCQTYFLSPPPHQSLHPTHNVQNESGDVFIYISYSQVISVEIFSHSKHNPPFDLFQTTTINK